MNRILVIDDEEQIRNMLMQMLESAGYEVSVASNGIEGMIQVCDNEPDLIITDIIMPGKEGLEIIGELRKNFPQIKVIAISGGGINPVGDYLKMAQGLGAKRVFTKPVIREHLIEAVRELLEQN